MSPESEYVVYDNMYNLTNVSCLYICSISSVKSLQSILTEKTYAEFNPPQDSPLTAAQRHRLSVTNGGGECLFEMSPADDATSVDHSAPVREGVVVEGVTRAHFTFEHYEDILLEESQDVSERRMHTPCKAPLQPADPIATEPSNSPHAARYIDESDSPTCCILGSIDRTDLLNGTGVMELTVHPPEDLNQCMDPKVILFISF